MSGILVYLSISFLYFLPVYFIVRFWRSSKHKKYFIPLTILGYNYVFFFLLLLLVEGTNTLGNTSFWHDRMSTFWMGFLFYTIAGDFLICTVIAINLVKDFAKRRNSDNDIVDENNI